MSFRLLNFKKPDGTLTGAIPEINGFGLIKTKTPSGIQDVAALYVNDGTAFPKLIWQPYSTPNPTNEPTEPTGPCNNNPACPAGTYVHYPLTPTTNTPRWDCNVWKTTAQTVNMGAPISIQDPDWIPGDPIEKKYCARVYSFNSGALKPPPPTYITVEYQTYTIADNFILYIKNNYVGSAADFATQSTPIFPTDRTSIGNTPPSFQEKHGALSGTYYYANNTCNLSSLPCPCDPSQCNNPSVPISPTGTEICGCNSSTCFITGVMVTQLGTPCTGALEYITNSNVFPLNTIGCLATDYCNSTYASIIGCQTGSCHGIPADAVPGDQSPSTGYSHRMVTKMPQYLYNFYPSEATTYNVRQFYDSLPTFNELALLSLNGCDGAQCSQPSPNGCGPDGCAATGICPSAYLTKIFLPFYVNVPTAFNAETNQTINLRGKYVELLKTDLKVDNTGMGGNVPITQYDNFPLLKQLRHLIEGKKRACGIALGVPMTPSYEIETLANITKLYFAAIEFPKIQSSLTTQTHQVVLEIRNGSANDCGACINTGGRASGTENISYLRLYPITDTSGQIPAGEYRNWLENHIKNDGTLGTGGINDIISFRHDGNGEGQLKQETNIATTGISDPSATNFGIYISNYNFNTGIVTPTSGTLTYELLMNLYNQEQVLTTVSRDCLCNPV